MNIKKRKYMKRRRFVDIDLLVGALIRSNKKKLKRNYEFKLNSDRSYTCPDCKTCFRPHSLKKKYTRSNPHGKRHYNLIVCHPKQLFRQSYLKNDMEYHIKGRRSYARPLLTPAIKYILGIDEYRIHPNQIIMVSLTRNETKLHPSGVPFKFNPQGYKRIAMSLLSSPIARRDIPIPQVKVEITRQIVPDLDYDIKTQPTFKTIDEVKPFIKGRIKFLINYSLRTKKELLFVPSFRDAEARRKNPDKITDGMKEWIELIDEEELPPKRRKVRLLSI